MAITSVRYEISRQGFTGTDHFDYNRPYIDRGEAMMGLTWNDIGEGNLFLVTYSEKTQVLSGNARKYTLQRGGFTNPPENLSVRHFYCDTFEEVISLYHLTVVRGQGASNSDIQHTAASSADITFVNELMKSSWKSPLGSIGAKTEQSMAEFYETHRAYVSLLDAIVITKSLSKRLGTGGVKAAIAKILHTTEHAEKILLVQFCNHFFTLNRSVPQVQSWGNWEDLGFPGFVTGHPGNTGNDKTINQKEKFIQLFEEFKSTRN